MQCVLLWAFLVRVVVVVCVRACVRVCMCAWQASSTFHLAEVGGGRRPSLLPSAQCEVSMQALGPASTQWQPWLKGLNRISGTAPCRAGGCGREDRRVLPAQAGGVGVYLSS